MHSLGITHLLHPKDTPYHIPIPYSNEWWTESFLHDCHFPLNVMFLPIHPDVQQTLGVIPRPPQAFAISLFLYFSNVCVPHNPNNP